LAGVAAGVFGGAGVTGAATGALGAGLVGAFCTNISSGANPASGKAQPPETSAKASTRNGNADFTMKWGPVGTGKNSRNAAAFSRKGAPTQAINPARAQKRRQF
jgi:hypothetical protein